MSALVKQVYQLLGIKNVHMVVAQQHQRSWYDQSAQQKH